MTLFEYVTVVVSMLMSLAVVQLVSGLSNVVAPGRRYWVHIVWIAALLLLIALHWWNQWAYQEYTEWNFLLFVSLLLAPGLLCFQAVALVPDRSDKVESWQRHFMTVRRRFFVALALIFLTFIVTSWMWLDLPLDHPLRVIVAVLIAIAALGAFSAKQRVHEVLAALVLLMIVIMAFWFFYRPGDFMSG